MISGFSRLRLMVGDVWTLLPFSAYALPGYKTKPTPAWCFTVGRLRCASTRRRGRGRAMVQASRCMQRRPGRHAYERRCGGVRCSGKAAEGGLQLQAVWALAQNGTG